MTKRYVRHRTTEKGKRRATATDDKKPRRQLGVTDDSVLEFDPIAVLAKEMSVLAFEG